MKTGTKKPENGERFAALAAKPPFHHIFAECEETELLSGGARCVYRGGNLNNGANAGLGYVNVNNGLSNSNTNIGSRLAKYLFIGSKVVTGMVNRIGSQVSSRETPNETSKICIGETMKRFGNFFDEMISVDNLRRAHYHAKLGKKRKSKIHDYEMNLEENLNRLHESLASGSWRMSGYRRIVRRESGKTREIFYDPCYEDTIVQHAIGIVLGVNLIRTFIPDTFASMKNRGAHRGLRRIKKCLAQYLDMQPIYIFKFDLRHFYASIDHDVLKDMLRGKVKDRRALDLLFGIIDSHNPGLPIGNYISPMFANFLLSEYDHMAREKFHVDGYFRYLDDVVVIDSSKDKLRVFRDFSVEYMREHKLEIKANMQIFPIERYGLDFMGFVFQRHVVRLRKRIERGFRRAAFLYKKSSTHKHYESLASYWGWLKALTHGKRLWYSIFDTKLTTLEAHNAV